jgi:Ca-activated chloride channel homolog
VLRARADEVRAEARALGDRGQFEGAAAVLRRLIGEIQAEPGFTANDGSPLAEALEQILDEAVAMERKPSQEQYQSFRRSQLGVGMDRSAPAAPESAPMSRRVLEAVAGALPRARLVTIGGDKVGDVFPLAGPSIVIGRTKAADIQIKDANISRQHSIIMGQAGRFVIADMGSTNTTLVNGKPLFKACELRPGDVVKVGDVELRYEEDAP